MKLYIFSPSFSGGGAEKVAINLANQYANDGINVTLVVIKAQGPYKELVNENVNCISFSASRARYAIKSIVQLLNRDKPTHVLSVMRETNLLLGIASFFTGKFKLLYREANTLDVLIKKNFLKRVISKNIMRLAYMKADFVIANSEDTKADLVRQNIVHNKKVPVIGNPVLPFNFNDLLDDTEEVHDWFNDSALKVILNVGRLVQQKNQALLINAFKLAANKDASLRLVILGEGELESELKDLIVELNLTGFVQILPFVINPFPYYKRAKAFVLTSRWEGFGNVIVESLASGTPVISVNCPGGPASILDNGRYGILVNEKSEDIASAILVELEGRKSTKRNLIIQRGLEYSVHYKSQEYMEVIR